ncbi:hypothetical protein HBI56_135130 [Parastagonospora nodorum]|uniref:Uncharacterized protein n=1 Tax=Phaeosphaeria nodorum (strain SN15 / ATCC MYA-4574 / FGSC 10173) TaxID=321614 RepID=A0A7U2F6Z1_PHANO|nr:hypothetical protein HBH56_038230 [Parastagonospora nodorum]QRC99880.1 hypothetical protein JI435_068120 [Parastagonospora nodorum SN15]KAH3934056.1 hypothetical protein HBH54_061230 [Parastagonospora nodorum]KAH3952622.1 hypothetical protein HBH53_048880 [Parastagonospora nodorum]KAH3979505.1 hypothetical protein HBH51_059890 [Parastagonospora nodorum]
MWAIPNALWVPRRLLAKEESCSRRAETASDSNFAPSNNVLYISAHASAASHLRSRQMILSFLGSAAPGCSSFQLQKMHEWSQSKSRPRATHLALLLTPCTEHPHAERGLAQRR